MNKAGTQRIETERLILRRFTLKDAVYMYYNWASDPEVTKYLTWPAAPQLFSFLWSFSGQKSFPHIAWVLEAW